MRVLSMVLASLLAATAPVAVAANDEETETPEVLPDGPGRDETFYFCTACHASAIIRQQGMSRALWDDSLNWMTERHGMPKLEGGEREVILNYLSTAFPPRQKGRSNPFLKQ